MPSLQTTTLASTSPQSPESKSPTVQIPSLSASSHDRTPPSSAVEEQQKSPFSHLASTVFEKIKGKRQEVAGRRLGDRGLEAAGRRQHEGAGKRVGTPDQTG